MLLADTMRPVTTQAEKDLFWELYERFTKKTNTDWTGMTREWNVRVAECRNPSLHPKRISHLKAFEKSCCKIAHEKDSLALLHSIGLPPYTPETPQQLAADMHAALYSAPPVLSQQATHVQTTLISGAIAAAPQPLPKPPGSRATGAALRGQLVRPGKGGKNVGKTCRKCWERGIIAPLAGGHKCPYKDNEPPTKKKKLEQKGCEEEVGGVENQL